MINLIDYRALAGIIKEGLTILNMLVANPLDENATNGIKQADAKFPTAVAQKFRHMGPKTATPDTGGKENQSPKKKNPKRQNQSLNHL